MSDDSQEPIIIARDVNKWYGHFQALYFPNNLLVWSRAGLNSG